MKTPYDPAFWDTEIQVKRNNEKLLPLRRGGKLPDMPLDKDLSLWQNIPRKFNFKSPTLYSLLGGKPLVISFLAGGWNRYGLSHLQTLKELYTEIKALNGNLLVVLNASYTDSLDMMKHFAVDFNVLVDPHNEIAARFGIFSASAPVWERVSGISEDVPLPATFVSDTSGTLIYETIDADFDKVFPATEVLGAVFAAANRVPYSNKYRFA